MDEVPLAIWIKPNRARVAALQMHNINRRRSSPDRQKSDRMDNTMTQAGKNQLQTCTASVREKADGQRGQDGAV